MAGHVGIVYCRAICCFLILTFLLPNSQAIREAEGFAVADDHADDFFIRNPRTDPSINAHLSEENLIFRAEGRNMREGRKFLLVCTPAHFCWRGAFFT